jgi:type I restriction enzyme, S subunit
MKQTTTVSFDQAFAAIPVGSRKLPAQRYCGSGDFAVVDQGQKLVAGYTDNNDLVLQSSAFDPWIVFGDHTRIVKFIEFPFVVGADGVRLFKARSGFDHLYLYYFLRSAELPNDGYGRHSKHLAELQVPLLSLDAQRHIAIHLKTQLAAVDDARLAAEAQLQEATRLIHSIIRESAEHPDSDFATLATCWKK